MVITSWSCWLKTQQDRLNTLVNIEPAVVSFQPAPTVFVTNGASPKATKTACPPGRIPARLFAVAC